ncbi:hypothetical protein GQ55_2G258900 [Panicum hallii var. hallii]|uniref:C2H2-type domain-containing protein n=1 Tax=Panicum hallii var. hallii TaxID=1504633 RepID=A0A2T7ESD5_9POAL|nr:hypothetical protein GQ55_2G258900 [Panicum hallii var. hallii]
MEFFAGRGIVAAPSDDEGGGSRFPEPQQHGDSSMLVIRDALLSQLQKDRLRQDIIMAELARIERAMALRSAGGERADPVRFPSNEHFVAHSGVAEHGVGADDVHDLKKNDGVTHDGVGLEPEKPAMEDHAGQCFKTCCSTGKMACQENAALDEFKMQESSQAKATSEGNLQQHFAGQRHQSKVAALVSRKKNANCQKATPTAEEARNVRQYAAEKPHPTWLCRFCQSNCTCKSDLENHLRGKRHKAKIQALLEECKNTMMDFGSTELKSYPNNVTKDEENPASIWNCSLCQTKCTRQSGLENHLKGKRHQLNFLVLQVEAQQYLSDWRCGICLAKCKSASQFEDHCSGRGHKQKIDALLRGGTNARSSAFQAEKKPPSDGSNIKGGISEETGTQRTMYTCKLCNLHCNSKKTLAEHRRGKKHIEKVEKRMSLSYCEVCNLQCNSEKMFAHHRMGKTHLAKVNGC